MRSSSEKFETRVKCVLRRRDLAGLLSRPVMGLVSKVDGAGLWEATCFLSNS